MKINTVSIPCLVAPKKPHWPCLVSDLPFSIFGSPFLSYSLHRRQTESERLLRQDVLQKRVTMTSHSFYLTSLSFNICAGKNRKLGDCKSRHGNIHLPGVKNFSKQVKTQRSDYDGQFVTWAKITRYVQKKTWQGLVLRLESSDCGLVSLTVAAVVQRHEAPRKV